MPETTNAEIVAKTTAINLAVEHLITKVSDAALTVAKGNASALTSTDYTIATWAVLTDALDDDETTELEVTTKTTAIDDAIDGLVLKADLTDYNAALVAVTEADYTSESWEIYQIVVGNNVVTVENSQSEVTTATSNITTAQSSLVFAGLADLNTAKDLAASKFQINYTEDSWNILTIALELSETTNALIVTKTSEINDAIDELVVSTNLTALTSKINSQYSDRSRRHVYYLTEADYSEWTWLDYTCGISNAISTEYNINSLQTEVNASIAYIDTKLSALVFAGQEALDFIISSLSDLESENFTTESWEALTLALALPETTNAEVVAKTEAINNVNLVLLGQEDLDAAKEIANSKIQADYTPESWEVLTTAEEMIGEGGIFNSEIVAKTEAILAAIDGLVFAGQEALDTAKAIVKTETDYTPTSWTVLVNAKALPETTNAEVVAKTTAINNAIDALVFAGQEALDTAKAIVKTETDYTSTSWTVLVNAKALPETTNAEVVAKTTAINNAIDALVFAGKANLDTAKALAATKVQSQYTTTTWATLTTAKALPETTNAEVVAKTTSINTAINNLVFVAQPVLTYGSRGTSVTFLQQLLVSKGYTLSIDGSFGPQTLRVVKAFQLANRLVVDGSVGPKTWAKLLQ